ncbi:hypothetical protein GR160_05940 [Flavobacterium sp. Sd200]|uniref:hypothetical protein n=1 Tax=Flavobacterium sp. Sd200 TaxID=2692211 RepID=UPI0013702044|nr:hypothetical protein [Flavobacterium sp. Sd200]MXN90762.1 hypothetical protein [Flavobacterium sp. Sd200]
MKKLLYILLFAAHGLCAQNAVWQWSIPVTPVISTETGAAPQAFLWIPENCRQVRGVVIGQHNMSEEGILEHAYFRKKMAEAGLAEIWVTPGFAMVYNHEKDSAVFDYMLKEFANVSGYKELEYAPIVPIGHSAYASYPWNFAAFNNSRTLAIISVHGDSPQTNLTGSGKPNPDWEQRDIDGIPALFIMGEYEWWEDRIAPGFNYVKKHPGSAITFFADAGHGHFDSSDILVKYIADYIVKAAKWRLTGKNDNDGRPLLKKILPQQGWLGDRWHKDSLPKAIPAKYKDYKGNRDAASWFFDKNHAEETEKYYAVAAGKLPQYIGFTQQGKVLKPVKTHANYKLDFKPLGDGVSFAVSAFFSDSTKVQAVEKHAKTKLVTDRICGPIKKINNTLFRIDFYRMGFKNPKRSNDIWLLAHNEGDENYKSAVQQLNLQFPVRNVQGEAQQISFPEIHDVQDTHKPLSLTATASSGLPVYYYVNEGPAYVEDNILLFSKVPPKAKYPIKVTVVAWQYGVAGKWQSATPVQQTFTLQNR